MSVQMRINPNRLAESFRLMSEIGRTPKNGVNRLALTDNDVRARNLLISWVEREKLGEIRIDDVGNIFISRPGSNQSLPEIIMGSHLDSVPFGGRFDGVVGVLGGLEVLRTFSETKLKHTVTLSVFTNEEGSRFQPSILGSGTMVGTYDLEYAYGRKDSQGITFKEALTSSGFLGTGHNRRRVIKAYLELHIEQGPLLEGTNIQIGIPTAIPTLLVLELEIHGETNHAGPTPMELRHDALVAASKAIVAIRDLGCSFEGQAEITIGRLSISPNVYNAIPGEAKFTVDIRSPQDAIVEKARLSVDKLLERICSQEGTTHTLRTVWRAKKTYFDSQLVQLIEQEVKQLGFSSTKMLSWAGHDAQMMAKIAPTAMIFIPCKDGRTHCEEEYAFDDDLVRGTQLLANTVLTLDTT